MSRLVDLLRTVVFAAIGSVVLMSLTTLQSTYPGSDAGFLSPAEKIAVAHAGACTRYGPISVDGFGFWWRCDATVEVAGGRVVHVVVGRSILTPADAGKRIEFRESCRSDGDHCSYGRPVSRSLRVAVGVLAMVNWILLVLLVLLVLSGLLVVVLGRSGYTRLRGRASRSRHTENG